MSRPDRRGGSLSDDQVRELEALDLVLAGGQAAELDPDHATLVGLVAAVRDDHPPLRPAFADELGRRVSGGFSRRAGRVGGGRPADPPATRALPGLPARVRALGRTAARPQWLIGLGGAAAAALAAIVVIGGLGSPPAPVASGSRGSPAADAVHAPGAPAVGAPAPGSSTPAVGAPASGSSTPAIGAPASGSSTPAVGTAAPGGSSPQSLASGGGSTPSVGLPAPAPSPLPAPGGSRAVERQASISLLAPRGQVQTVVDGAIAATDRLGGVVASSNVTLGDQGGSQATLALVVPGAAVERTLAALSSLAHVSARSQDTLDITDATHAARQRLAESQAERVALLRQLGRATTPGQVASIHAQLGLVGGRIAGDEATLAGLVHRATTASVTVTITESARASAAGGSGWAPTDALAAALDVLEVAFAILVIALAGLLPLAAVGAGVWYSARVLRRRRHDDALAA